MCATVGAGFRNDNVVVVLTLHPEGARSSNVCECSSFSVFQNLYHEHVLSVGNHSEELRMRTWHSIVMPVLAGLPLRLFVTRSLCNSLMPVLRT